MKTYLSVRSNLCQRCNNRWTSSFVVNSLEGILAPTIKVDDLSGFYHSEEKHQACFNCMPANTPQLPSQAEIRYKLNTTSTSTSTSTSTPSKPKPEATPLDLFGD